MKDGYYISKKENLDYDKSGRMRREDGMCGWLFNSKNLISRLKALNCEVIYIQLADAEYRKFLHEDFDSVEEAYRVTFSKFGNRINKEDVRKC